MKLSSVGAALLWAASGAFAAQEYCNPGFKPKADVDYVLDLSKLNRKFTVTHKEETPPTMTITELDINICQELTRPDNTQDEDYCPNGAYICRRVINDKHGDQRVLQVQSIAGDIGEDKLNPVFSAPESEQDLTKNGIQFSLVLNGGKVNYQPQSAHITLECDSSQNVNEDPKEPTVISYQNNVLSLNWKTVHACATKPGEQPPPNNGNGGDNNQGGDNGGGGMSGAGIFFTIVGVLAALYFLGGAFYNYKVYNARGLDLIPHRDFWLDLPYLIKDLISHVIDSIMSHRRGSGGYVAV